MLFYAYLHELRGRLKRVVAITRLTPHFTHDLQGVKCVCPYISVLTETILGGDKVSVLTHIYRHKPLRKTEVTICNHQADSPLNMWPDV